MRTTRRRRHIKGGVSRSPTPPPPPSGSPPPSPPPPQFDPNELPPPPPPDMWGDSSQHTPMSPKIMFHPAVQDVLSSEIEGRRTPIARPVPVVFGARIPYRIYDDAAADDGAVEAVPQRSSELGHEVQAQPISSRTFYNLRKENMMNMMREKHFENVLNRALREHIKRRRAEKTRRKRKRGSRSRSRSQTKNRRT